MLNNTVMIGIVHSLNMVKLKPLSVHEYYQHHTTIVLSNMMVFFVLSSSLTRVPVKVGLFNARIQNENDCYTPRLIHQLNEQDLLCN